MKKFVLLAAVAALFVGMLAGPASAAVNSDAGFFQGVADVAKTGSCSNGAAVGFGSGGLGLPLVDGQKTGVWALDTSSGGQFQTLLHGNGVLKACGKLGKVPLLPQGSWGPLPLPGRPMVGAACGISKGYDGEGFAQLNGGAKGAQTLQLRELGWKVSVGGTLPVSGRVVGGGTVVALVQAQGGAANCSSKNPHSLDPFNKNNSKVGGATQFQVVGVFAFVEALNLPDQDATPLCKNSGCPWYPEKK